VLLAVFGSLRWGELAALRRSDVDLSTGTIHVFRQLVEKRGGGFGFAPPKSDAGKRIIVIPRAIIPVLREHVARLNAADDSELIFTSPEGAPLWHGNFRNRVWLPALEAAGLPTSPGTGAGLRELMDRMGHSTTRAALIYLHASDDRQRAIADALSKVSATELKRCSPNRSGTQRARKRRKAS
jgi:integrase